VNADELTSQHAKLASALVLPDIARMPGIAAPLRWADGDTTVPFPCVLASGARAWFARGKGGLWRYCTEDAGFVTLTFAEVLVLGRYRAHWLGWTDWDDDGEPRALGAIDRRVSLGFWDSLLLHEAGRLAPIAGPLREPARMKDEQRLVFDAVQQLFGLRWLIRPDCPIGLEREFVGRLAGVTGDTVRNAARKFKKEEIVDHVASRPGGRNERA
jgi:hypothetical protein